jgi:hypothetical protein
MKNGSSGAAAARGNGRRESEIAPEVVAAPFVTIPVEPIDSPMWPIHPPGWFQPEARAAAPSWSGVNIERRNRIPAPDLVHLPLAPFDRAAKPDGAREPLVREASPKIPESALELLGWDPRAFGPNKELK